MVVYMILEKKKDVLVVIVDYQETILSNVMVNNIKYHYYPIKVLGIPKVMKIQKKVRNALPTL